jgi:adenylate cyclase
VNWIARHRLIAFAIICAFWAAIIVASQFFPNVPLLSLVRRGERAFEDLLRREGRKTPIRPDVVFVGIDQQSLQLDNVGPDEIAGNRAFELMTEKPFPWSREIWVLLMDRLFAAGARLLIFDMIFNNPNEGDAAFRLALDRYRDRVVIGENIDVQQNIQMIFPNTALIVSPEDDDRVGFVNFFNNEDGRLRSARFFTTLEQLTGGASAASDRLYTSMDARALEKIGRKSDVPRDQSDHLFRFSSNRAYSALPLWMIFDPKSWHANLHDGAPFKNKIIIV